MQRSRLSARIPNTKLERINNLIKAIKRRAFGFWDFNNLKKLILIPLNIKKREQISSSHGVSYSQHTSVDKLYDYISTIVIKIW